MRLTNTFLINNIYDHPDYGQKVIKLKERLAALRKRVGDDGQDFPKTEKVLQEFWDYDSKDREKAKKISADFLKRRLKELDASEDKK